jgi:LCP family protein required for cell wall assembly
VRTTTKRGLGRAATLNGNGRAVLPPVVLEPMRRYRQPPPPPRSTTRLAAKVFGWILLALLVVASGLAGGVYLYGHETLNAIAAHSKGAKAASKDKHIHKVDDPTQPATALVIGYDDRKGVDAAAGQESRSDTLMLVRADPSNDTLSIISFPRDLDVAIYCPGSDLPRVRDRINSAWSRCGEQGTLDTVARLTNIPIHYVITVDFHGFKLLVNKLKGVYVAVDHRYYISPNSGVATVNIHPGYQKLDGQKALDFVRFRHTDSDLYRNARQQLFLDALKDRLASSFHIAETPKLVGALKGNVEVVQSGGGAPALDVIQSYVGLGYKVRSGKVFRITIPNLIECGYANAQVCADPSDIASAAQKFMHPDVTLAKRANCQVLGCKTKTHTTKALTPSQITTLVLNGTTIGGLARDTSYKLAVAGFKTVQLPPPQRADAPRSDYYASYVYYDTVQAGAKQAAQTLQRALGSNTQIAALTPEITPYAQQAGNPLTVTVVGAGFDGQVSDPTVSQEQPPAKAPARVRSFDATSSLAQYRAQTPFQVMTPTVVEQTSSFTSNEPIRSFKPIAHRKELVMTFVTGAGNIYWQIIETNWTDAPILRRPTGKYVDKKTGRKFDLFTSGGNIHMVVYRANGATYWVMNTLRDELSNETMLAIARGLRPLGK